MTIYYYPKQVREQVNALGNPPNLARAHALIGDILETRGLHLHRATSDLGITLRKQAYRDAIAMDRYLLDVLTLLPHNIPEYCSPIIHPITGAVLYYQRYDDAKNAPVYVRKQDWNPEAVPPRVVDRRAMLVAEQSRSTTALEEINEYVARGLDPVTERVAYPTTEDEVTHLRSNK